MSPPHNIDLDDKLRTVVTVAAPLGPLDSVQLTNADVAAFLFDRHSEPFRAASGKNFLVGRCGSGKTAVLQALTRRDPKYDNVPSRLPSADYIIQLKAWQEFTVIGQLLSEISFKHSAPIELVTEKWQALFWSYLATEIVSGSPTDAFVQSTQSYKELVALSQLNDFTPARIRSDMRAIVEGSPRSRPIQLAQDLLPTWQQIRDVTTRFLFQTGRRALLTIDSMEQYPAEDSLVQSALSGLIRAVALTNDGTRVLRVQFCLPYEIFRTLSYSASNPLKDFQSIHFIEWSAKELLKIAAHRYRLFLRLYDQATYQRIETFDLDDVWSVLSFWASFFPPELTNRVGIREKPLHYLLRHTQLLPRQLFHLLSEVIVRSHNRTGGWRLFPSESVQDAVASSADIIALEVFGAFQNVYPGALAACRKTLAGSGAELDLVTLESLWRENVAAVPATTRHMALYGFAEMLDNMGVLGTISPDRSNYDQYVFSRFSYNCPDNEGSYNSGILNFEPPNRLSIHPLFHRLLGIMPAGRNRYVCPLGALLDEE